MVNVLLSPKQRLAHPPGLQISSNRGANDVPRGRVLEPSSRPGGERTHLALPRALLSPAAVGRCREKREQVHSGTTPRARRGRFPLPARRPFLWTDSLVPGF